GSYDAAGADRMEDGVVHGDPARARERTRDLGTPRHKAARRSTNLAGSSARTVVFEETSPTSRKGDRSPVVALGSTIAASRPAAVTRRIGAVGATFWLTVVARP